MALLGLAGEYLVEVNAKLAAKLLEKDAKQQQQESQGAKKEAGHHMESDEEDGEEQRNGSPQKPGLLLDDERFSKMFKSADFEINEDSEVSLERDAAAAVPPLDRWGWAVVEYVYRCSGTCTLPLLLLGIKIARQSETES